MPTYNTLASIPIPALFPGDQFLLFNAEQPSAGTASQQIALANIYDNNAVQSIAIELFFSGAPGAFEIDVQVADTDQDSAYITINPGGLITTVNANQFARLELSPVKAKFLRVKLVSRANAVNVTVKVTR